MLHPTIRVIIIFRVSGEEDAQCATMLHTPHIDCRVKRFVNSKKAILTTEPMRMIIDRDEVHAVVE